MGEWNRTEGKSTDVWVERNARQKSREVEREGDNIGRSGKIRG